MTQALEAAKRARDRGANVQWARAALKEARAMFMAGDYARASAAADSMIAQLEAGPGTAPDTGSYSPGAMPGTGDRASAAGRLAEATETVKAAKAHGFNVQVAKTALKQAKRAFRMGDYAGTLQFAEQAIQLSGSTNRARA